VYNRLLSFSLGSFLKYAIIAFILFLIGGCGSETLSKPLILKFSEFGPPSSTFELIGTEWFQWKTHGSPNPHKYDNVQVVVYRNRSLEEIKIMYPVIESKEQDYRYLHFDAAIKHLKYLIPKFKSANLPNDHLSKTLNTIQRHFQ
jgi:hypothetical protein